MDKMDDMDENIIVIQPEGKKKTYSLKEKFESSMRCEMSVHTERDSSVTEQYDDIVIKT